MSYVALGLFILACGWNLYRDYTPTRTRAIRIEGHPQYFGAALAAGYVLVMAVCLNHAFSREGFYEAILHRVVEAWPHEAAQPKGSLTVTFEAKEIVNAVQGDPAQTHGMDPAPGSQSIEQTDERFVDAIAVAFWSAGLAFLMPFILNLPYGANRRLRHLISYDALEGVERILVDAANAGVMVAITLTSRKFYVGIPLETDQDGTSETRWIRLNPLASGYRSESGSLEFTTAYQAVYAEMSLDRNEPKNPQHFRVTIPTSQIVSIQHFDLDLYTRRFSGESSDSPPEAPRLNGEVGEALPHWARAEGESATLEEPLIAAGSDVREASEARPPEVAHKRQSHLDSFLCALSLMFGTSASLVIVGLAFSDTLLASAIVTTLVAWITLLLLPTGRLRSVS